MLGFLRKLFGRSAAPGETEALASALADYVKKLRVGAALQCGLGEKLAKAAADPAPDLSDVMNTNVNMMPLAQLYIVNLVMQAAIERGIDEAEDAVNIITYVLQVGLRADLETWKNLVVTGMLWRGNAMAALGERAVEDGEEVQPLSEDECEVYEASNAAGRRFAILFGHAGAVEPNDTEMAFFARHCALAE